MKIKKGDTVIVVTGKDKGKKGKVHTAIPKRSRVVVEGVNMLTKHQKPSGQMQPGGIIHQEGSIDISNVMLYCTKDKDAVRVGYKELNNGDKVRICKKCGEVLD